MTPGADRRPGVRDGVPEHRVLGDVERAVGAGGFGLEGGPEWDGEATERVVDDGGVDQVPVDVAGVGVAQAADRVPDRAIRPDPEVADADLLRAGDARFAQAHGRFGAADDIDVEVFQLFAGREGL